MKQPCELIVWHIIPAIRKEFARKIVDDLELSQKDAARILGVTEAAVSQYRNSKRGMENVLDPKVDELIGAALKDITDSPDETIVMKKICEICKAVRAGGHLCEIHRKHDDVKSGCTACMEGCS